MNLTQDLVVWRAADALLDQLLELDEPERRKRLDDISNSCEISIEIKRVLTTLLDADQQRSILDGAGLLSRIPTRTTIRPGQALGRWQIAHLLDEGGMGSVYLAHAIDQPEQRAAIKLIHRGKIDTQANARMMQERALQARLQHPFIVQFFEAGSVDACTDWIAMAYVDGLRIDTWCQQHGLSAAARILLVLDVCEAISFAHQSLVVHRDLKPSNVLVERSSGRVQLLDFGIAQSLQAPDLATDNARLLTPQYAAPEQFSGAAPTTAMDVFGLGALLYRLLTGTPPRAHIQPSSEAAEALIAPASGAIQGKSAYTKSQARAARTLLHRDLDGILSKAMATPPSARYASVDALASDLRAALALQTVQANNTGMRYRAYRFFLRHRSSSCLVACLLLALLGTTLFALQQAERAHQASVNARQEAASARQQAERASALQEFTRSVFEANAPDKPTSEIPSTLELLQLGTERARLAGQDPHIQIEMLLTIASVYAKRNQGSLADQLLTDALQKAQAVQDPLLQTRVQLAQADRQVAQNRFAAGIALLDQAQTTAESVPLSLAAQRELEQYNIRHIRAFALAGLGQNRDALKVSQENQAWLSAQAKPQLRLQAQTANQLGVLFRRVDQLANSVDAFSSARSLNQRLLGPNHLNVAIATSNIASAFRELGRFDQAHGELAQAIRIFDQISLEPMEYRGAARFNVGETFLAQADFQRALQSFDAANAERARYRGIKVENYPYTWDDRARVLIAQEDFFGALQALQMASKTDVLYARTQARPVQRFAWKFALCYCRTRQANRAQEYLSELRNELNQLSSPGLKSRSIYVLGECAWAHGDWQEANQRFQAVAAIDAGLPEGFRAVVTARAKRIAIWQAEKPSVSLPAEPIQAH